MSALPMKTLDEFKAAGGALVGGHHSTHEEYEGAPRPYNDKLATTFDKLEEKFHHGGHHSSSGTTTGTTGVGDHNRTHHTTDSGVGGVGNDLSSGGIGRDNHHTGNSTGVGDNHLGSRDTGATGTSQGAKPSLADRLNPRVDADGDGKRGFMD
jgi:hypothetical protein